MAAKSCVVNVESCECGIMIRVRHDQETILFKLQNSLRRLAFDNEIFEYILLFKCMEATGIFVSKNGCFSLVVFLLSFFRFCHISLHAPCLVVKFIYQPLCIPYMESYSSYCFNRIF